MSTEVGICRSVFEGGGVGERESAPARGLNGADVVLSSTMGLRWWGVSYGGAGTDVDSEINACQI